MSFVRWRRVLTALGRRRQKCSSQMSRRGWNSRVNNPVSGSRPPRFSPLWEVLIQAGQPQVFGDGRSEVLLSNDVVDLESAERRAVGEADSIRKCFQAQVPNQTFQCLFIASRGRRSGLGQAAWSLGVDQVEEAADA